MRRLAEDPSGAKGLLATIQRELATQETDFLSIMSGGPPRDIERIRRSLDEYWFAYNPEEDSWTWAFSMDSMPFPDDTQSASRIMRWLRFADGAELESSDTPARTFRVRVERLQGTEISRVEIVVQRLVRSNVGG